MAKTQKTLGPRVQGTTADWLNRTFGSTNAGAEYLLAALPALYARTISDIKKQFSAPELYLIIDVHNGMMLSPGLAGQHIIPSCIDSMELDGTGEKWGIGRRFSDKLVKLSLLERACLEIWAAAFWEQHDQPEALSLETYVA